MPNVLPKTIGLALLVFLWSAVSVNATIPQAVSGQKETVVTVTINDREDRQLLSESGFIVHGDGIVAVSCNAISKWYEAMHNTLIVTTESGTRFFTEDLLSKNCRNNIALITVKAAGLSAARLAPLYRPKEGEDLIVLGRLPRAERTGLEGRIKSIRETDGLIRISVPLPESLNGGPVFNRKGDVIGIATSLQRNGKTINFVLPIRSVSRELDRYNSLIKKLLESNEPAVESSRPLATAVKKPPQLFEKKEKLDKITAVPKELSLSEKQKAGKDGAAEYFLQGYSYAQQQKYSDAIDAYRIAISIDPRYVNAYMNMGVAYYKTGNYAAAIDSYRRAIGLKRDDLPAYSKLGAAYIIIGNYSKAIDTFKHAARIEPANSDIHFQLGVTFLLTGNKDGAISEYTILKKIDMERAEALLDLIY